MSRYSYWGYFKPQPTVWERKEKAAKTIARMRKKGANLSPVEIEGRTIEVAQKIELLSNKLAEAVESGNAGLVQSVHRLVQNQNIRIVHDCLGDPQLLLHS